MLLMLMAVAVVSALLGEAKDAIAILVVSVSMVFWDTCRKVVLASSGSTQEAVGTDSAGDGKAASKNFQGKIGSWRYRVAGGRVVVDGCWVNMQVRKPPAR